MRKMLYDLVEHLLPRRVREPLDERASKAAIDASRLVNAQARQFQLEVEIYQRAKRRREEQHR